MVLVAFAKESLDDARPLTSLPADILTELCKLSVDHLKLGVIPHAKAVKASEALSMDVDTLIQAIHGLAHILLECARRNCSPDELLLSLESIPDDLPLKEDQRAAIRDAYTTHLRDLRSLLSDLSLRLPHYQNLEWRLDVQLASRTMRNQVTPILLVELETKQPSAAASSSSSSSNNNAIPEESTKQLFQLDYANLDHLVKELEAAVKEANTKHSRRILRYVK